jgi:hypothetical protein
MRSTKNRPTIDALDMLALKKSWSFQCMDEVITVGLVQPFTCTWLSHGDDFYIHKQLHRIVVIQWSKLIWYPIYRVSQEGRSIFWEVIVSVILSKKVYMYMCPFLNGFRGRAISLYSSKIVGKKEILQTVSDTGIYCSSDKVVTVYLL